MPLTAKVEQLIFTDMNSKHIGHVSLQMWREWVYGNDITRFFEFLWGID